MGKWIYYNEIQIITLIEIKMGFECINGTKRETSVICGIEL